MDGIFYNFPAYIEQIANRLYERSWFMYSFDLQVESDAYNPAGYLYNSQFNGVEYIFFLDLNIYQYILSAYKKINKNEIHRDAIALIVFGKITNAIFDPTLAIYEKLNYDKQCSVDLIDDLKLFRGIDNSDADNLAKFALGLDDCIVLGDTKSVDIENLKFELTKYNRLKKWDNFYVFILKISELHTIKKLSNEEKISSFLMWCFNEFMFSLVAISLVITLWGKNETPKLMKYESDLEKIKKIGALKNMTWDLFLLDKFFENWKNKNLNQEFIFVSNDAPLKKVLEIAISIQKKSNFDHLTNQLSPLLIEELKGFSDKIIGDRNRGISKAIDFKEYRDSIIKYFEKNFYSS